MKHGLNVYFVHWPSAQGLVVRIPSSIALAKLRRVFQDAQEGQNKKSFAV
ncbi:MAG TPA: hypothetical protein VNX46_17170 [Candidatus Acidoferrum sp.]|jgi:hypothetical protein|nr:hypothetical protein [Candidatus Acidoferrum sp.]